MGRFLRRARTGVTSDDAGMGLIMVIGISVFIFAIATTATMVAVNSITQSRQREEFETSLALAETGVDRVLSLVQGAYDATNSDYPVPSSTATICAGGEITYPPAPADGAGGVWTGPDAEKNERDWARAILQTIAADPACIQHEAAGQYVVFKPPSDDVKYGRVYSLSAMPSFADPDRTRLIKSEYIFMPYRPMHAVLSGGNVNLGSSSTLVTEAAGVPIGSASVHANGVVSVSGAAHPTVSGTVTYSGATAVFGTGGQPLQRIPEVSARRFYFASYDRKTSTAPAGWFDLCPDGTVRPYAQTGPCTSPDTSPGTATSSHAIMGWTTSGGTWRAGGATSPGTYYAHEANIQVDIGGPNIDLTSLTLVASAANPGTCGTKSGGNIAWKKFGIHAPNNGSTWMLADSDIYVDANITFGDPTVPIGGMFAANDQIRLETSSSDVVGSVVIGDVCDTPAGGSGLVDMGDSQVNNLQMYFAPNSDAPFSSVITTSLWLDYTGA